MAACEVFTESVFVCNNSTLLLIPNLTHTIQWPSRWTMTCDALEYSGILYNSEWLRFFLLLAEFHINEVNSRIA